jgi:hypothetical protein
MINSVKKCREIANRLWAEDPKITIARTIKEEEIIEFSKSVGCFTQSKQ